MSHYESNAPKAASIHHITDPVLLPCEVRQPRRPVANRPVAPIYPMVGAQTKPMNSATTRNKSRWSLAVLLAAKPPKNDPFVERLSRLN